MTTPEKDAHWYDRMYNNRAMVPEFGQYFDRWVRESAAARSQACSTSVAYGAHSTETLDIFPANRPGAPVLVFIHGGYWRFLDKFDHSFVALPFQRAGCTVVVPNYALCPAVTVPDITLQMVRALAWVSRHIGGYGGDPSRITVAGHSAGGHLAAMLMACQWQAFGPDLPPNVVRNALSISGLHELESVRRSPMLQSGLLLTDEDVLKASPAWLPAPARGELMCVVGGDESEEFLRQNALMQQAWGNQRVPQALAMPGRQHFSMLDALCEPTHAVHRMACDLLGVRPAAA
jgi:arylformamidase